MEKNEVYYASSDTLTLGELRKELLNDLPDTVTIKHECERTGRYYSMSGFILTENNELVFKF